MFAEDEQEEKKRDDEAKAAALKRRPKKVKPPPKSQLVINYISQFIISGERYREFSEIDGINVPWSKADRSMIHNICARFWCVLLCVVLLEWKARLSNPC